MYLLATTEIPMTDVSVDRGFITGYSIEIKFASLPEHFEAAGLVVPDGTNDQGDAVADGGTAVVDRLHLSLVDEEGHSLFDACDADSQEWEAVYSAFLAEDSDHGFFQDIPETEECYQRDVLLIHDISLKPEYKGRGIEMAVARRIIETIGSWCDLIVYNFGNHLDELDVLAPMGFRPGPVEGYAFLNPNFEHQKVKEVSFCKFIAEPDEPPEPGVAVPIVNGP